MVQCFNFVPSATWTLFIVLPLLSGVTAQNPAVLNNQVWGVALVAGFLASADWIAWTRDRPVRAGISGISVPFVKSLANAGLATLAFLLLLKIAFSEKVPLFEFLAGESLATVKINREIFERGLGGWWGARILNSLPMLIGMPTLACLISMKKPLLFLLTTIIIITLTALSSAKAPTLLFLISLIFLIYFYLVSNKWAGLIMVAPFLALFGCAWFWIQTSLRPSVAHFPASQSEKMILAPDLSDSYRCALDQGVLKQTALSYLSYRVFLVPVCVSYRWYEFTRLPASEKEIRNSEATSPSNLVGRWAYFERFPNQYQPNVRAYASVDADAFYRGGFPGLVAAGLLIFICRILFQEACFDTHPALLGLKAYGFSILAFVPYQGSVQALIFPQGLGAIILAGFLVRIISTRECLGINRKSLSPPPV